MGNSDKKKTEAMRRGGWIENRRGRQGEKRSTKDREKRR
jgi:hypothetical protein